LTTHGNEVRADRFDSSRFREFLSNGECQLKVKQQKNLRHRV
jgi:hypothetical protein